jgi:hypothetical protein
MGEYVIKVGFWLRAFDSVTIEAPTDADALAMAKGAAVTIMESHADPEAIDLDERREGSISHIDRVDHHGREEIAGFVRFDDDRLHAPLHDFIERIAALSASTADEGAGRDEALRQCQALIEQAKALRGHVA